MYLRIIFQILLHLWIYNVVFLKIDGFKNILKYIVRRKSIRLILDLFYNRPIFINSIKPLHLYMDFGVEVLQGNETK